MPGDNILSEICNEISHHKYISKTMYTYDKMRINILYIYKDFSFQIILNNIIDKKLWFADNEYLEIIKSKFKFVL